MWKTNWPKNIATNMSKMAGRNWEMVYTYILSQHKNIKKYFGDEVAG